MIPSIKENTSQPTALGQDEQKSCKKARIDVKGLGTKVHLGLFDKDQILRGTETGFHHQYEGTFKDKKFHGVGTLIITNPLQAIIKVYNGIFVDGVISSGYLSQANNSYLFTGSFRDGAPYEGPVINLSPLDPNRFSGTIKEGKCWNGEARTLHPDGSIKFEGTVKEGRCWEGNEKRFHPDGSVEFEGTIEEGTCWNGKAKTLHPDGSVEFEGTIKKGKCIQNAINPT
jgi:antitoxin component YwqK of YwqJK toxin-antitoxin module